MRRSARTLALAVVAGLIALSLLAGAAAAASGAGTGAPTSLTHRFPLGTQTLSHSNNAAARGSTTPHRSRAAPHRSPPPRAVGRHGGHGFSSVLFLLAIPIVIVAALLGRVAIRRSRSADRPRAGGRPTPARSTRLTAHSRWAYEEVDEVERAAPPLPVRRRGN